MSKGLSDVASTTLQRLRDGLQSGQLRAPMVRSDLVAYGETTQLDALIRTLGGHPRAACIALVEAVLAERAKLARPAPELVWTGPEAPHSSARDTAVVLRDLFDRACQRVVLAGYSFSHSSDVLGPLFVGMRDRGVHATFFVEVAQPHGAVADPQAYGQAAMSAFVEENWPFGSPYPSIYCDARAIHPGPPWASLHAKCVAVDGTWAFASSANFTQRGQGRNIETGVLLHEPAFAAQLERQWFGLVKSGLVVRWQP